MTQPSFDPSTFLKNVGSYNEQDVFDPSAFNYSVDISTSNISAPLNAAIAGNPEFVGLFEEWKHRTQFNGSPNTPAGTDTQLTFVTQVNTLFLRWSSENTNPSNRLVFPRTWGDFITQFRTFFGILPRPAQGDQSGDSPDNATAISSTNLLSGPAWDGFVLEFQRLLKTDTDWADLNPNTVNAEIADSFAAFLDSYPFSNPPLPGSFGTEGASGPGMENIRKFINNWRHFNTITAVIDPDTTTLPADPDDPIIKNYVNLLSYKETYKAFFPNSTDAEFTAALQAFQQEVNADKKDGGYFLPSQQYDRFFDEIKNKLLVLTASQGSMMANAAPKLEILWEIFATVLAMIQTLQKTTAILAQRLGFLTNYQKAYTELIAQIPTLLNDKPFSADDTGPLNSKLQAFAENLRSFRGVITDDSKGLQSSVNGLNESGNQQANLATDLLQQMSSLLSTIMK